MGVKFDPLYFLFSPKCADLLVYVTQNIFVVLRSTLKTCSNPDFPIWHNQALLFFNGITKWLYTTEVSIMSKLLQKI